MGMNLFECVLMVRPSLVPFLPRGDMLHNQIRTELLGFGDGNVSSQAKASCGIIDRYKPLPLL